MTKVWYITGTSKGFGRAWAQAALERGDVVAATARDTSSLDGLVEQFGDRILPITLDVRDRDASVAALQHANQQLGRIDVVVNNAGYGHFGFLEELTEDEARGQLDTNLFGALWTTQAAIPILRSQGGGHIVQVSSMGGVVAFPSLGIYHASKWALEGLTEALAAEVAPFNIRTTLIEPAGFATDWATASAARSEPNPLYDQIRQYMAAGSSAQQPTAVDSVPAVLQAIDADQPPKRLLLGGSAYDIVLPTIEKRLQTWRDWESVTRSVDAH